MSPREITALEFALLLATCALVIITMSAMARCSYVEGARDGHYDVHRPDPKVTR